MMFANEFDIYVPKDRKVQNVKVGDKFKAGSISYHNGTEDKKVLDYTVVAVYPYHVRTVTEDEKIRCFTIGELVRLKLEPSNARGIDTRTPVVTDYDD